MSGIPLLVEPERLRVLVVGGGAVATRKLKQFATAGAVVRVVSPTLCAELEAIVEERDIDVTRRAYQAGDIGDAQLIIAATNDQRVNGDVARDADAANRLVNVTDFADGGTFAVMAVHRRGALTIGVGAGGVPAAAVRIRDAIAERFDARYGDALHELSALRRRLIAAGKAPVWKQRSDDLIGPDFCDDVENGTLAGKVASWP